MGGCTAELEDGRLRERKGCNLDERLVPDGKLVVLVVFSEETGRRGDADSEMARIAKINVCEIVGGRRCGRQRERRAPQR